MSTKVVDINSRRRAATEGAQASGSRETAGLIDMLVFLVSNPLEVVALMGKIELIKNQEKIHPMTNARRAAAQKTVSQWDAERIIDELIGADTHQIQTKPALHSVALEKLLAELMKL